MESIDLSKEELKRFFNKYNSEELANIKKLLQYASNPKMAEVKIAFNEVYTKKDNNTTVVDKNYKLNELTEKELTFLYELIYDKLISLSCIKTPVYEQEVGNSSRLLSSIEYEIETRKTSGKVKTLSISR